MTAGAESRAKGVVMIVGLLIGVTAVALALLSWRVPRGSGALETELAFFAVASGELEVSPAGSFAYRRGLRPSRPADGLSGRLDVRNQTGRPLRVRLRAPADRPSLDELLHVEAVAGDAVLFRGRLALLRTWTRRSFELAAGERRAVTVRAWVPTAARRPYAGRMATLNVEFQTTASSPRA